MAKLLTILLLIGLTRITLINYLGTTVITYRGSHLDNLLTRECGYILIGKKLPAPPWSVKVK